MSRVQQIPGFILLLSHPREPQTTGLSITTNQFNSKGNTMIQSSIRSCSWSNFTVLGLAVLLASCATMGNQSYTIEKAEHIGNVLRTTARSAVVFAWMKDTNSVAYLQAVSVAIGRFMIGTNLSPQSLSQALSATTINELKTVEGRLALNTCEGLYEVFWGDFVRSKVSELQPLKTTLQGLSEGLMLGVRDTQTLQPKLR